jgi:hypothetical protein
MSTVLAVYNQALGLAGARANLASTADKSRERELCDLYYATARDESFAMAYWPELKAVSRLALIAERDFSLDWADGDPHPPWRFAYALPTDYVRARYLASMNTFEIGRRGSERIFLTNQETPVLVYTSRVASPGAWDTDLFQVVVATLALNLAGALSFSDAAQQRAAQNYQLKVPNALVSQANLAHLHMPEVEPLSSSASFYLPPDIPASVKGYMGVV